MIAAIWASAYLAAQATREREERELARLKALPPEQAQLELLYRQTRALERAANRPTQINVRSSLF